MAKLHAGIVLPSLAAAFVGWVLAAQYAPVVHLLPYVFVLGLVGGVVAALFLQTTGSQAAVKHSSSHPRAPYSSLGFSQPLQFDQQRDLLNSRRWKVLGPSSRISQTISKPLDKLLALIVRDNVQTWLSKITKSDLFTVEVHCATRNVVAQFSEMLGGRDIIQLLVIWALPIFNDHVESFQKAESTIGNLSLPKHQAPSEAVDAGVELATRFKGGSLHSAASLATSRSSAPQQKHLRRLVDELILPKLAPQTTESPAVRMLVREIVACAVLGPLIQLAADPDFLFQQIETHGRTLLHESSAAYLEKRRASLLSVRSSHSSTRAEQSVRMRESTQSCTFLPSAASKTLAQQNAQVSLRDTLYDVAGLSYFMEFMDQFNLVCFVQFWITADGLGASLTRHEHGRGSHPLDHSLPLASEADRQVIHRLYERFISHPAIAPLSERKEDISAYLELGQAASAHQYRSACLAVSQAQNRVFREMEDRYLSRFKTSQFYRQWMGVEPAETLAVDDTLRVPPHSDEAHLRTAAKASKPTERLRRNPASSTDLSRDARKTALKGATRRSLDEDSTKRPLFEDDDSDSHTESISNSISSLTEPSTSSSLVSGNLSDGLVDSDVESPREAMFPRVVTRSSSEANLRQAASPVPQRSSGDPDRPSLDSLGLLGTPSKRTVFTTDDLFGEKEDLWEDEDQPSSVSKSSNASVREAKPGDLGLPEAIESLSLDIDKLESQQSVLSGLLSKAELTNNSAELKILRKSLSDLNHDLRRRELQRQQYIVQASDNNLFRRTTVSIASVHVGKEYDGREYALYDVILDRRTADKMPKASWNITKRYSEFHDLHRRLRTIFPHVRDLPFPKRQVVPTLQDGLVQRRRGTLEQYLRHLLNDATICQTLELRAFLSEQPIRVPRFQKPSAEASRRDVVSRLYAALSEGLEDFVGNASVLDQLSMAGQNLISTVTANTGASLQDRRHNPKGLFNATPTEPQPPPAVASDPEIAAEAQAEILAFNKHSTDTSTWSSSAQKSQQPTLFIEPIASCFSIVFRANSNNNWLRGRAVVIVLQQLLGGTVERRVRDMFSNHISPAAIGHYIDILRETLWPKDIPRGTLPPRMRSDRFRTQRGAEEVLCALLVENAGAIVGRNAAKEAAKGLVRCLAHERLNLHLLYTLVDKLAPVLLDPRGT